MIDLAVVASVTATEPVKSDDDMSLESGEEEPQKSDEDDDDDGLYNDLDDASALIPSQQQTTPSSNAVLPDAPANSVSQSSDATTNSKSITASPSSTKETTTKTSQPYDDAFVSTILQILLDVVGLDKQTYRLQPKNNIELMDPTTASSTLSQKVRTWLSQRISSVETTNVIMHSIGCAFVQCATLIMMSSSPSNTHQLLDKTNANNRGYTSAKTPSPTSHKKDQDVVQDSILKLLSILTAFFSHLGTLGFTDLLFPKIEIDEAALSEGEEEENMDGYHLDLIFVALTRVRKILEPVFMYVLPLLTRWGESRSSNNAVPIDFNNGPASTKQTLPLRTIHAETLKNHLFALGEARFRLDADHPYNNEKERKEGNLLRPNMIHLFLIELATQQRWTLDTVRILPRVVSSEEGQLELLLESSLTSLSTNDNRGYPHAVIVDMSIIQDWLHELPFAVTTIIDSTNKGYNDTSSYPGNSSEPLQRQPIISLPVLPSNSPPSTGRTLVHMGNNRETNLTANTRAPISILNQWFQQGFGIEGIKKHFHIREDLSSGWTGAFHCPITHDVFPCGQYGFHYITDAHTGIVWHTSLKEAEHAAAARMVDSIVAAQHLIPQDCKRIVLGNLHAFCRGQMPLPVRMSTYISTYRYTAVAKAGKLSATNNNNIVSSNIFFENETVPGRLGGRFDQVDPSEHRPMLSNREKKRQRIMMN